MRARQLSCFVGVGAGVALLAAAQLLPFLDLLGHSHRLAGWAELAWSLPAWGWANLLLPLFQCHPTGHGVILPVFIMPLLAAAGWSELAVGKKSKIVTGLAFGILAMSGGLLVYGLVRPAFPEASRDFLLDSLLHLALFATAASLAGWLLWLSWKHRQAVPPLITAGQQPVFLPLSNHLARISASDFQPLRVVYEDRAFQIGFAVEPTRLARIAFTTPARRVMSIFHCLQHHEGFTHCSKPRRFHADFTLDRVMTWSDIATQAARDTDQAARHA